ncbi:MAG: hypothetical protein AB7F22_25805 [Reyranella sp.]|uniref:hypothetical protein n=1 Tax=Reyranella sp. TaxID=1929291 RepID=UPI003D0C2CDB
MTLLRLLAFVCLVLSVLCPGFEALAAGGPHIVDDAEVETPGVCHLETWATRFIPGDGYFNLAPACTTLKMPWLEIGAAYQHYWDESIAGPLLGPAMKINFQSVEKTGLGIGLGFNAGVNVRTGELGYAQILGLVTYQLNERVRLNFNAGWSYLQSDVPNALFYGAQVEANVGGGVNLMLEAFGRAQGGLVGTQAGLRFTPRIRSREPFDFDLLVGTFFDDTSTRFVTLGVTARY